MSRKNIRRAISLGLCGSVVLWILLLVPLVASAQGNKIIDLEVSVRAGDQQIGVEGIDITWDREVVDGWRVRIPIYISPGEQRDYLGLNNFEVPSSADVPEEELEQYMEHHLDFQIYYRVGGESKSFWLGPGEIEFGRWYPMSPSQIMLQWSPQPVPIGYNIPWIIFTVISLMLAGGYLILRRRRKIGLSQR